MLQARTAFALSLFVTASLSIAPHARAQQRPYIGYVYPAGGQQGTTFQIRLGGQTIDDAESVMISGDGASAKLVETQRRLNNQEVQLLREQLRELKRNSNNAAGLEAITNLALRIEKRVNEFVQTPACASIASLVLVEVTLAPDAEPGDREIRLVTRRGVSNPLVFQVGEIPEHTRKPMLTATIQVLGKEASALRKRPPEEVEAQVSLPCTLNGQIASGEINKYRFSATQGQKLVFSASARHLVPFIADAVPGWFQPVLALYDAAGKEVAFSDDYEFRPDPVIFYEVPSNGEYTLVMRDGIYRGREDFVYRISAGELPFVRSIFPLGGREGETTTVTFEGWNLDRNEVEVPARTDSGIRMIATSGKKLVSNRMPFEISSLPEFLEREPNNKESRAQKVKVPCIIDGRIDQKDDWDIYQIEGSAGASIKAEVCARKLTSPLDSVIKLTDASGKLIAFNDDSEDPEAGINTHPSDSLFTATFPSNGTYYVHIGDTSQQGSIHHSYRLRLSEPQPDFALRAAPSSIALRSKNSAQIPVYLYRKDGFNGPVKITVADPPTGFAANPVTLTGTQVVARLTLRTTLESTKLPLDLKIIGTAKIQGKEFVRQAIPAEDRTQAFFWRHMVPSSDFEVVVYNPAYQPPPARPMPEIPVLATNSVSSGTNATKQAFSKQQIAGRLRQLSQLFQEGLLTEGFYGLKVAECNAAQP